MRILMISPIFPPASDAESICGGKFAQGLLAAGVDLTVLHSSDVRMPVRVDASSLWDSLKPVSIDIPSRVATSRLERLTAAIRYQSTSWSVWSHRVVSTARTLHSQRPFDLVISRSLPSHGHLAGYWASSALGVPWVAIVNDPWDFSGFVTTEAQRREWTPGLNWKLWWRRVVAKADLLCFPCPRLRDFCLRDGHRGAGVSVLPHIGGRRDSSPQISRFLLVHAGKLGLNEPTGRSAGPLFTALEGLLRARAGAKERIHLLFVGPEDPGTMSDVKARGLAGHVSCTGLVSYEQSLEHISLAAICILVEADVPEGIFLPSKLCDYVTSSKPVLALSPAVGTVSDIADPGVRRVNPSDAPAATSALIEMYDAFEQSKLVDFEPSELLKKRFDSKPVIDGFLESLDPLLDTAARCVPDARTA